MRYVGRPWGAGVRRHLWDEGKGAGQECDRILETKKFRDYPGAKNGLQVSHNKSGKKNWVGSGCGSGIDSKSGKREGGFSDRASRTLLGEFGFGSEDAGETDSGGEKIGGGNLLLASASGCSSGFGKFNRTA